MRSVRFCSTALILILTFCGFFAFAPEAQAQSPCTGTVVTCAAAMMPHTWVEVTQNSTASDVLGCQTSGTPTFNSTTNELECMEALNIFAFTTAPAWDSNTNTLHFVGKDHGASNFHYVQYNGNTNNWSNVCPTTGCTENGDNTLMDGGNPNDTYPCVQDWGLFPAGLGTPGSGSTGAVTSLSGGTGYSNASNVATTTSGSGSNLTVDIITSGGAVTAVTVDIYPGVGHHYADGDTVTISGGGGNATFIAAGIGPDGCARGHGYGHISVSPFTDTMYFKMYGNLGSFPPDITKNFTRTLLNWAPGASHSSLESNYSPIYEQISSSTWIPRHRDVCIPPVFTNCSDTAGGSLFVYDNADGDGTHVVFGEGGNAASYDPLGGGWYSVQTGFGGWPAYSSEATFNDYTNQVVFGGGYGGQPGNPTCPNPNNGTSIPNFFDNCFLWKMDAQGNITRLNDSPIPIGTQQANMVSDPNSSKIYILSGNPANTSGCSMGVCGVNSGYVLDLLGNGGLGSYTAISGGDVPPSNMTVPDSCPPISPNLCSSFMSTPAPNLGVDIYVTADYFGSARTARIFLHKGDGQQDFATRCSAPGVILCEGFDTTTFLQDGTQPGATFGKQPINGSCSPGPCDFSQITQDTVNYASGGGSLKIHIPNCPNPDCSGSWETNFDRAHLNIQFGAPAYAGSTDFYVGYREMFSSNWLANDICTTLNCPGTAPWTGGEGTKQSLTGSGDQTGGFIGTSCSNLEVGLTDDLNRGIPQLYTGCQYASTENAGYRPFEQPVPGTSNIWLQNGRGNPYCLHDDGTQVGGPGYKNCFEYVANEWLWFQQHVHVGPRGTMPAGNFRDLSDTAYNYTSGTIGGHSITAGSVGSFTPNLGGGCNDATNSAAGPCEYIYYPGSGSVLLATTSYTTATTGGATPLVALETDSSGNWEGVCCNYFFPQYLPSDEYYDSYVELWAARDGGYEQLLYSIGPMHLAAGLASAPEYYGKIWLLPYDSDRTTNSAPPADTWWDELTVSNNRIQTPTQSGTSSPANFTISETGPGTTQTSTSMTYTVGLGNSGGTTSGTSATVDNKLPTGVVATAAAPSTGVSSVSCTNLGVSGATLACTVTLSSGIAPAAPDNTALFTITATASSVAGTIIDYVSVDASGGSSPPTPGAGCSGPNCANVATVITAPPVIFSRDRLRPEQQ